MRKRRTSKARATTETMKPAVAPKTATPTVARKPVRKRKISKAEQLLTATHSAIFNISALGTLQTALAAYGYTSERIEQGKMLYQVANRAHQKQESAYTDLRYANSDLRKAERTVQELYMRHVQLARLALADDSSALEALHLNGQRKSTFTGWTEQAQKFYTGGSADSAVQTKLDFYGLNAGRLAEGMQQIDALTARHDARDEQRRIAKEATSARNAALTDLDKWMSQFKLVARIALRDEPWMLKQIGIRAK